MPGSDPAKTFLWFQAVNFALSILIRLIPLNVAGVSMAYPLFSLKVMALIWFNTYPQERAPWSRAFFIFACLDVACIFLFGAFSIYSLALSRVF